MAQQKVRYPRRGGVVQAEAYMWYAEHCAIPPQREIGLFATPSKTTQGDDAEPVTGSPKTT